MKHSIMSFLSVVVVTATLFLMTNNAMDFASYTFTFYRWVVVGKTGLFAILLSVSPFDYFFLFSIYSFVLFFTQLPRLVFLLLPPLFMIWLNTNQRRSTVSVRRVYKALKARVQKLKRTNAKLYDEIVERRQ